VYRQEFAEDMLLDFSDMAVDASKRGIRSLMFFYLHELADFPVNLLKVHWKEAFVNPHFQPGAARNILRIAFAFGLALALDTFAGILAFMDQGQFPTLWRFLHSMGWRGTYQDIQSILLNFSNLILGPVLAAITFLIIFPEIRPIKRYLPAIALVFSLPAVFDRLQWLLLKDVDSAPGVTIFAVAYLILVGLGFGVLAGILSRERRKIPWLLLAGSLGQFLISWASNLLILNFHTDHSASFWGAVTSVAMRNMLMGAAAGLLLGIILEFKRRDNSPHHFSAG